VVVLKLASFDARQMLFASRGRFAPRAWTDEFTG
jgi:hypothetical protein